MTPSLYSETFGQGPDLLLLHGWGMHSGVWGEFAELLARDFRVTAVDLPGHGHSRAANDASLAGWTDAVLAVAPDHAHWLGWSLGAQVALQAAATRPERVKRLLMFSGNPSFVRRPGWPTAMAPEVFEEFSRQVEREGAAALSRFLGLQARGAARAGPLLKQVRELLEKRPAPPRQVLLAGLEILRTADLRSALAGLACPAMALFGASDGLVPVAAGEALRQLYPSLRVEVLPGAAHLPFLSHPAECAGLVAEFVLAHDRA